VASAEPDLRELRRTAFTVVATCFIFNIFSRGIGDAFTVMVLPLEREFGWSRARITGIYSTYLLVSGLAGPVVGMLFGRFGPRIVYTAGLVIAGLALVCVGSLDRLWQFYLVIGLAVGVGVALVGMVPASALLARWYSRRLSTMIGIVFSAVGMGALVIVPIAQQLSCSTTGAAPTGCWDGSCSPWHSLQFFVIPWRRVAEGDRVSRRCTRPTRAASSGLCARPCALRCIGEWCASSSSRRWACTSCSSSWFPISSTWVLRRSPRPRLSARWECYRSRA